MRSKGAAVKRVGNGADRARRGPAQEQAEPVAKEAVLRPSQCRRYMRKRLAEEFRGIVQGFVEGARTGSCSHVKLVTELLAEPDRTRSRKKGSATRMLEELGSRKKGGAAELWN